MIHITVTDANGERVAGESFESVDAAHKWLTRTIKSQRLEASQPAQAERVIKRGWCHCEKPDWVLDDGFTFYCHVCGKHMLKDNNE